MDVLESLSFEMAFHTGKKPVIAGGYIRGVGQVGKDMGLGGMQISGHDVGMVSRGSVILQPLMSGLPHLWASPPHCTSQPSQNVKIQMFAKTQSMGNVLMMDDLTSKMTTSISF